jgi:aminodeoxyfutalosine synthase
VVHETIYHAAGSDSPQELPVSDLRRLIEEAGRVPVERDTLYREVIRSTPVETAFRTGRRLELV